MILSLFVRSRAVLGGACCLAFAVGAQEAESLVGSSGPDRPRQLIATNAPPPPVAPDYSAKPPPTAPVGTSQLAAPPPMVAAPAVPLLQWGPVQFHPHLSYRLSYGDGIQARPGENTKTWINEFSPGILLRLGRQWTLDYTPTLSYYSSSKFRDTWENAVSLSGGTTYNDWAFGLSQAYSSSSQPLVETGAQTDQETFNTALSAAYQVNSEMSLQLGLNQNFRFLDEAPGQQLTDSRSWSTMNWLNYQFDRAFGAAIGIGFAYDDLSAGSDTTSEQVQGRVTWRPAEKLDLSAYGGLDIRQFLDSEIPNSTTPIFGLSVGYALFETTTLSLNASRTVSPSYYSGQVSESTTLSAGLSQRLLGILTLSVSGGLGNTSYQATTTGPAAANVADYDRTFFNVRLSTPVLKRGTIGIFYQHSSNSSDASRFDYSTTQGGLDFSYRL